MKTILHFFKTDVKGHFILILLASALLFIPNIGTVAVFDWDEANFAEAAREMIMTGDYMRVRINYEPFWEKPPLFFWLQALSMKIFGINEFAARFVNAFWGCITLSVLYLIGRRIQSPLFGILWVLAYAGSFLPHLFFKSAIIDPVFNLFIFIGIFAISRTTEPDATVSHRKMAIVAGLSIGLAVLTKGPVAFLVTCLCIGVFWILQRFLKKTMTWKISTFLLFTGSVGMVSFIYYGIETILHGTWFMEEFIKYHLRLLATSEAGHGEPFYYHAVVLLFGCFPASFFALRILCTKTGSLEHEREAHFTRWMKVLFWVVLILFSIVKTKTVLYSSLTYFPITYLAAWHINAVISGRLIYKKGSVIAISVFGVIVASLIAAFPLLLQHYERILPYINDRFGRETLTYPVVWSGFEFLIGVFYALLLLVGVFYIGKGKYTRGFSLLFVATALCLQTAMSVIVPKVERISQGVVVDFYKEKKNEGYVMPLFKSYVNLFYTEIKPDAPAKTRDIEWLLKGEIDKPAFFVCRITSADEYRGKYGLIELSSKYGFVFFKRPVPNQQ